MDKRFQIQNRRYIGNKYKLKDWIFSIINKECKGNSFADIFAGTGIMAAEASKYYKKIIINDFLYSNYIIYYAFFSNDDWDVKKINRYIKKYNQIVINNIEDNYFSINFGGKYFSRNSAKIIGFIREDIEKNKLELTKKEYCVLITSLIYSIDRIANTVGHFDAYFKKEKLSDVILRFTDWPLMSYSLKDIAQYLNFNWRDKSPSGAMSIEWFNKYLETKDKKDMERILLYNEDDCKATMIIKDFLDKQN